METPIHSLEDKYIIQNTFGYDMTFSAELLAWNSIFLILLTIASLAVMVNRMTDCNKHNALIKLLYGGLAIVSLGGLLYPIEFGLLGVNIVGTIILGVDYFKYKKK